MNNDIRLYQENLPDNYSKLQELDKTEFNGKKYQTKGERFDSEEFKFMRFKDGYYEQCDFIECRFYTVGLSGTHFLGSNLKDFMIIDSNLQFCDFSQECTLQGTHNTALIDSSNLSQSMFHNSTLQNIKFKSTTVSQARFINTSIHDVVWESCTLQDNVFDNVTMNNVSLVGCNLEYSDFKSVQMKNVALPLHQLPYAFGILQCLKYYPNEIVIAAISSEHAPIKPKEYIKLLPELFSYYTNMNDYFPAINIALFWEDYERANSLIDMGTQYYIKKNDFRKLKAVCKLVADNPFYDKHYMTLLYYKLVEYYNSISVSEYERYQYSLHINDIKEILTGFNDDSSIQLYLKTNITSACPERMGVFYKVIEECFRDYGLSDEEYAVEIRHNSDPLSFWIVLSQNNLDKMLYAVGVLMSIVADNPDFFKTAIDVMGSMATIGSFAMQIAQVIKDKKKTASSDISDIAVSDINYINKKSDILKSKEISVEVALPFFKLNYRKELQCKSQS